MSALNMADLLLEAYNLADLIKNSPEAVRYIELKQELQEEEETRKLMHRFQIKKEKFEECQRFGHYHPDYHKARKEARECLQTIRQHPKINEYLELEEKLDHILNEVSRTIARSVSDTIKVPINDPKELRKANKNRRQSCG